MENNNFRDIYTIPHDLFLPPVVPNQIGPTCSYHAIVATAEATFRGLYHKHQRAFPRLAVKYIIDFNARTRDKHTIMNYTRDVGMLAVSDYSEGGLRGEGMWTPADIFSRPHYRVKEWQKVKRHRMTEVMQRLHEGLPLYADFFSSKEVRAMSKTGRPVRGFPSATPMSHSVVIVGYGVTNEDEYYYVYRDSGGPNQAINGYGRIMADSVGSMYFPLIEEVLPVSHRGDPRRTSEARGRTSEGASSSRGTTTAAGARSSRGTTTAAGGDSSRGTTYSEPGESSSRKRSHHREP